MVSAATIRKRDVIAFTRGDCHVLARAIQRRTGWPIYALTSHNWGEAPCFHAFVRMPDGRALDVLGARTMDEMVAWAKALNPDVSGYVPTDAKTLRAGWGATALSTYAPKRARRVADELLRAVRDDERWDETPAAYEARARAVGRWS